MQKLFLIYLFLFFICLAQVYEKPLLDTTRIVSISLLEDSTNQTIVSNIYFKAWDKSVYWYQTIFHSGDTLYTFAGSFDWRELGDLNDSNNVVDKDSVLHHIRSWFFNNMSLPKRCIISTDDERRSYFKKLSRSCFGESYKPFGFSDNKIDKIDSLFWMRHSNKPIICIEPPLEPVQDDDKDLYVYDSFTKKIVLFYTP